MGASSLPTLAAANGLGKTVEDDSSVWTPATCVGDLSGVPGPWLCPVLALTTVITVA